MDKADRKKTSNTDLLVAVILNAMLNTYNMYYNCKNISTVGTMQVNTDIPIICAMFIQLQVLSFNHQ